MKAVYQRVSSARVVVDGKTVGEIGKGALVLLGVEQGDTAADAAFMARKCVGLRVFEDRDGKMNLSLADVGGAMLLVSQFTLCGDTRKGRRPSFGRAAPPSEAEPLYQEVKAQMEALGIRVETGVFQAHMEVHLINDGPVTLLIDSRAGG